MWREEQARLAAISLDPSWEFDVRAVMHQADVSWFEASQELLRSLDPAKAVANLVARPHNKMHPDDLEILQLRQVLLSIKDHNQSSERSMDLEVEGLRLRLDQKDMELTKMREALSATTGLNGVEGSPSTDALERDMVVLRHDLRKEEDAIISLQRELETIDREMKLMRDYSDKLEKDVASLRAALSRVQTQSEGLRLKSLVSDAKDVVDSPHRDIPSLRSQKTMLETTLAEKTATMRRLIALAGGLKAEHMKLQAQAGLPSSGEAGLGMQLSYDGVVTVISAVHVGGPAYVQGLAVGDRVIAIDNQPIAKLSAAEVGRLVRGPAGTRVILRIQPAELAALHSHQQPNNLTGCVDVVLVRRPVQNNDNNNNSTTINLTSSMYPVSKPITIGATPLSNAVVRADGSIIPSQYQHLSPTLTTRVLQGKPNEMWLSYPHEVGQSIFL